MSRVLHRYRIWCSTENAYVYEWAETEPTDCPNNNGHTIDTNLTTIIDNLYEANTYGVVLDLNSTNVPLGASGTFTGTFQNVLDYSEFTMIINDDTDCTYFVDFSTDGVNTDRSLTFTHVSDQAGYHAFNIITQFMRVRIQNTGTPMTYLRLQSIGHTSKSKALTTTTNVAIRDDDDVQLMRLVNDPLLDFARNITNNTVIRKFGSNFNLSTTKETIWSGSGPYYWMQQPETLDIVTNSIEDGISGLGARKITLNGLDANFNEITEEVNLVANGTATTINPFFRIFRSYLTNVGTYHGSNYNDIEIKTGTSGIVLSRIDGSDTFGEINTSSYGNGQSQQGLYTIPAGFTGFISRIEVIVDQSNRDASIFLFQVQNADQTSNNFSPKRLVWRLDGLDSRYVSDFKTYIHIPEKTDLWFEALASAPLNNSNISVTFDMFLVENT